DRQTDRQKGRQTERQADRQRDRQTDRQTDTQTERRTDRQMKIVRTERGHVSDSEEYIRLPAPPPQPHLPDVCVCVSRQCNASHTHTHTHPALHASKRLKGTLLFPPAEEVTRQQLRTLPHKECSQAPRRRPVGVMSSF